MMLCPEVWNFASPEPNIKIEKGDLKENAHPHKINSFYYNHLVSVVVPSGYVPRTLTQILIDDCDYYKVFNLNLKDLLNICFIKSFIAKGNLTLLSINSRIDCENCVSLSPDKKLTLSLVKESYQCSGLEGKVSHFNNRTKYKYVVTCDLSLLVQNKQRRAKLQASLERLGNFNVIVNWEPPNEEICPSSVAKYFHNLGYKVEQCRPSFAEHTDFSVEMPLVDIKNIGEDDVHSFVEWLGMYSLQLHSNIGCQDDFITTYEIPQPSFICDQLCYLQWTGFYTVTQVKKFITELRKHFFEENKQFALYVQGFSDSTTNWGKQEHDFYLNGDSSYVLLLNPEQYLLYTQTPSFKFYK